MVLNLAQILTFELESLGLKKLANPLAGKKVTQPTPPTTPTLTLAPQVCLFQIGVNIFTNHCVQAEKGAEQRQASPQQQPTSKWKHFPQKEYVAWESQNLNTANILKKLTEFNAGMYQINN